MTDTTRRAVAVVWALLLVSSGGLATTAAAAVDGGGETASLATAQPSAIDVVFVLDRSANGENVGESFGDEIDNVSTALEERGIDARYGLVTYESDATVATGMTDDIGQVSSGLSGVTYEGSYENASAGVLTAADMSFRADAGRLYVVLTTEDDSSPAAVRERANAKLSARGATTFVAGPDYWDSRVDAVGGTWYPVPSPSQSGTADLSGVAPPLAETAGELADRRRIRAAEREQADIDVRDVSLSTSQPTVGEPVEVAVTVENRGGAGGAVDPVLRSDMRIVADGERERLAPDESRTFRFVHTFDDAGSYVLALDHQQLRTVRVREAAQPATNVTVLSDDFVRASLTNAHPSRVVMADLPANGVAARTGVHVSGVGAQPPRYTNLSLDVTQQVPFGRTAPGVDALSRFSVRSSGGDAGTVVARFDVDRRAHPGLVGSQVFVQRLDARGQVTARIEPTRLNTTTDTYVYRFTDPEAPRNPTYRVVRGSPSVAVGELGLPTDTVRTREPVTFTATVHNDGAGPGLVAVPIWVDGGFAGVRLVHLSANETRTVGFTTLFTDAGRHRVTVGDRTAETVVAWPHGVPTPETESTTRAQDHRVR